MNHRPSDHPYSKFFAAVPQSHAAAVEKYGSLVDDLSQWDDHKTEENAAQLLERFQEENAKLVEENIKLKTVIYNMQKQLSAYQKYQKQMAHYNLDYLPYEDDR